ncbi:MAG TPA: type III-A CRISPR-associated RAMP protein Csm3 [Blastocatellia bacterium]|nr:type III-A CRISPR-associated RAMP protein Csm3 [Blastocatellia bacterium]
MAWKLVKYVPITGVLTCKSGLRIGGSKDDIGIGEMDNPIIRHPITKHPYIPGSSLKGKLRTLSEYRHNKVAADGQPHGCKEKHCLVCRVFGPHKVTDHQHGPTRLIVRDAMLAAESQDRLAEAQAQGVNFAEVKSENWINRNTGIAGHGGLRTQERVPADTKFDFTLSVRIFEEDDEQEIINFIRQALDWLPQDTLGSSGTRGYGWVQLDYKTGDK